MPIYVVKSSTIFSHVINSAFLSNFFLPYSFDNDANKSSLIVGLSLNSLKTVVSSNSGIFTCKVSPFNLKSIM